MPIYEYACLGNCPSYGEVTEEYFHSRDHEAPICEQCGGRKEKLVSQFAVVFTGPLSAKYNDPKLEGAHKEGHWGWRRKSARDFDKPEPVWLDSWEKRKRFMAEEHLIGYEDVGPVEGTRDGKWSRTRTGMPGTWI